MLDLTAIERVGMTNRIYQIQQRIANIQDQFQVDKFPTDFKTKLDREMERQDKIDATTNSTETQKNTESIHQLQDNLTTQNNSSRAQITEEEVIQAAKIILAVASGNAVAPNIINFSTLEKNVDEDNNRQKNFNRDSNSNEYQTNQNPYQTDSAAYQINRTAYQGENSNTEELLNTSAQRNGVDPNLVKAVAIAESGMNQNEISPAGAIGVMQLMPETAVALGVNPYDEAQNIEGGVRFLRQMLDKFGGNVPVALAAYNAGPGAVQRYGGIPPYSETQNYVGRILDIMGG